ncbi:MAG TPA: RNA polymerase sigma factor [Clostridia bacterium]|nr:RNA polymerase sigma factor [Clostridia bacterium]
MPEPAPLEIGFEAEGIAALARVPAAVERVTAAFDALRMPVYRYLLVVTGSPEEAEDIAQESFLRLYRQLRQGAAVNDARLWLFTVAHNLALDRRRAGRLECRFDAPDWVELMENRRAPDLNPEQTLIQKEKYLALRRNIGLLSAIEQEVLHLRSEGLRYRQIGEVLGIGTSTVSDALQRGVEKLKAGLHA